MTPFTGLRPSSGAAWTTPPHSHLRAERETAMTNREVKHTVYGRPGGGRSASRSSLDAGASRGLLTWWDLMSDLDSGWVAWTEHLDEEENPGRRAA